MELERGERERGREVSYEVTSVNIFPFSVTLPLLREKMSNPQVSGAKEKATSGFPVRLGSPTLHVLSARPLVTLPRTGKGRAWPTDQVSSRDGLPYSCLPGGWLLLMPAEVLRVFS